MKHLNSILFLSVLLLFSCSGQEENENIPAEPQTETTIVKLTSRTEDGQTASFEDYGITELSVFAYMRKDSSRVYANTLPVNGGELEISLPLGERLITFVVANAVTNDAAYFYDLTVSQDALCSREIFFSDNIEFISDNSYSEVELTLQRMVGQAVFRPIESKAALDAFAGFDNYDVLFSNVVTTYIPAFYQYLKEDVVISAGPASNYIASVYSYPSPSGEGCAIEVVYYKNNTEVTRTVAPLEVAIEFAPSKRTVVYMPVTDEDYLETPFSSRSTASPTNAKVIIEEHQF